MNKNKEARSPQFIHGLGLHIPTAGYLIKSTKSGAGDSSAEASLYLLLRVSHPICGAASYIKNKGNTSSKIPNHS